MRHYDLVVIGTGPAGQKAAIQAAKLGKHVAAVEKCSTVGGAQINTGTIPSKALREAAMHLTAAGGGENGSLLPASYCFPFRKRLRQLLVLGGQVQPSGTLIVIGQG